MSISAAGTRRSRSPADATEAGHRHAQGSLRQADGGRDRHRVRRHRHLADLRLPRDLRRPSHAEPDQLHIYGVLSLIFWSMMIIVDAEICHDHHARRQQGRGRQPGAAGADQPHDQAEQEEVDGGNRHARRVRDRAVLRRQHDHAGDLGAVGGRGPDHGQAGFAPYVIPIAIGILVGLFAIQSRGTAKVGLMFGPIMLVYFVALAVLGVMHIIEHPAVFAEMLNPLNAFAILSSPSRCRPSLRWAAWCSP